ncbi:MAG TPA: nuclear transport factor 2 family protein [Pseudonocardiaceae bacterium]|nr:nuclear transport factor 2 family protein [Pseudonocardiaceae bacterium]
MVQELTESALNDLAADWYRALDRHDDAEQVLALLVPDGLVLNFPEGTFTGQDGFRTWYDAVTARFFDEAHTVKEVVPTTLTPHKAELSITVNWQFTMHDGHEANSVWGGFDAYQCWTVVAGENGPLIKVYSADRLDPMPGSASL